MPVQVSCPSCGAPVRFQSAGSAVAVCPFCRSTLARDGDALKSLGKMAELLADDSPLQIGATGSWRGVGFTLLGRLQMRYGAGAWNEWHILFDDQRHGWLSDAQGLWTLTLPQSLKSEVPGFDAFKPGQKVALAGKVFEVTNKEEAVCLSGEGELPFIAGAGYVANVVDLRSADAFATLDYSESPPQCFVGEAVEAGALKLRNLRDRAREALVEKPKHKALALACPSCGSPWQLHDQSILAVACPACGALSDVDGELAKVREAARAGSTILPPLPLGSRGKLAGQEWEAIGFLRKSTVGELGADWDEYLLYDGLGGFAWLASERGHWNFIRQLNSQPAMSKYGGQDVRVNGQEFRHFASYRGETSFVLGEFTWKVAVGEQVEVSDYIAPPQMLSQEKSASEITWSQGEYLSPEEISTAFGLKRSLLPPGGINACQPNPYAQRSIPLLLALLASALFALIVHFALGGGGSGRTVFSTRFELVPGVESSSNSEAFRIDRDMARLELHHRAPLSNSWVNVQTELVNRKTGQIYSASKALSYYSGVDEGESWSEGKQEGETVFYGVPAGEYSLVVHGEAAPEAAVGLTDNITLQSAPAPFLNLLICWIFLAAWPVFNWLRASSFETSRWAWSDHPRGGAEKEEED